MGDIENIRQLKLLLSGKDPSKKDFLRNQNENSIIKELKKLTKINSNIECFRVFLNITKLEYSLLKETASVFIGKRSKIYKIDIPNEYNFDELSLSLQNDINDFADSKSIDQVLSVLKQIIEEDEDDDQFFKAIKKIAEISIRVSTNALNTI